MAEWKPIDELFDFEKGTLQSSKCTPGKYTFITAAEGWKTHETFTHDCEALIFAMAASGSLGRTHYVNGKFISSDLCFILTPKKGLRLDLTFYHRLFNFLRIDIVRKTATGTSKLAINRTNFGAYRLPYFDYEHQLIFRDKIETMRVINEEFFNEMDCQLSLFDKLRQAVLQEAIEGKLTAEWRKQNPKLISGENHASKLLERIRAEKDPLVGGKIRKEKPLPPVSNDEKSFLLPAGWTWCRLGELASVVRGGSPRPAGSKQFYEGTIPFLKVGDLTANTDIYLNSHSYTIKEAGLHKTRYVDAGTLMLTNSGATLGVPKICTFPATFNDGIAAFLGLHQDMSKVFLYYFLKAKSSWFLAEAARGQGQPNLNTDIIGLTVLALPPSGEQHAIVERVGKLLTMIDQLEEQVTERKQGAEQLMQSVLREAFESNHMVGSK